MHAPPAPLTARQITFHLSVVNRFDLSRFYEEFRAAATAGGLSETELIRVGGDPVSVWRPLVAAAGRPSVYISAGIHGDEPAGTLALLELLRFGILNGRANFTVFPVLNPSGLRLSTRGNSDGIDLNRDYLKCSTAEVKAHAAWLREHYRDFDLTLSLHEDWETSGFYLYEIITTSSPSLAATVLNEVAHVIPLQPKGVIDGHDMRADGYIHHESNPDEPKNWPEAIFHVKLAPSRSYTFETPSSLPLERRIRAHVTAVTSALNAVASAPELNS